MHLICVLNYVYYNSYPKNVHVNTGPISLSQGSVGPGRISAYGYRRRPTVFVETADINTLIWGCARLFFCRASSFRRCTSKISFRAPRNRFYGFALSPVSLASLWPGRNSPSSRHTPRGNAVYTGIRLRFYAFSQKFLSLSFGKSHRIVLD